jgi:putative flippase GtrA
MRYSHRRDALREPTVPPLTRIAQLFSHDPFLLLRYISAGTIAATVEFVLFATLYQLVGWNLLVANCTAFSFAVLICFAIQKNWTFRASGQSRRQLHLYLFMQGISAFLNNVLMFGLVIGLGIYAPVSKILQIGIVFIWNYSFCHLVVFSAASSISEPKTTNDSAERTC